MIAIYIPDYPRPGARWCATMDPSVWKGMGDTPEEAVVDLATQIMHAATRPGPVSAWGHEDAALADYTRPTAEQVAAARALSDPDDAARFVAGLSIPEHPSPRFYACVADFLK